MIQRGRFCLFAQGPSAPDEYRVFRRDGRPDPAFHGHRHARPADARLFQAGFVGGSADPVTRARSGEAAALRESRFFILRSALRAAMFMPVLCAISLDGMNSSRRTAAISCASTAPMPSKRAKAGRAAGHRHRPAEFAAFPNRRRRRPLLPSRPACFAAHLRRQPDRRRVHRSAQHRLDRLRRPDRGSHESARHGDRYLALQRSHHARRNPRVAQTGVGDAFQLQGAWCLTARAARLMRPSGCSPHRAV